MLVSILLLQAALFICLHPLVKAVLEPEKTIQLPAIVAGVLLLWVFPQLLALSGGRWVEIADLNRLLVMVCLSLAAVYFGWGQYKYSVPKAASIRAINKRKLYFSAFAIISFAHLMKALILSRPAEELLSTQWSGTLTILYFFSGVGVVGYGISAIMYMRNRRSENLFLLLYAVTLYVEPVLFSFRRAETFEFFLTPIIVGVVFHGFRPPRYLVAFSLVVGFAFINGVAHLRSSSTAFDEFGNVTADRQLVSLEELWDVDWFDWKQFQDSAARSEARNAVEYMRAVEEVGNFGFGAELWNRLIHAYVPGQFIGPDNKEALYIDNNHHLNILRAGNFEAHTGTTKTGFYDVFHDFWYFGCFVFYFMSRFIRKVFDTASSGSLFHLCAFCVVAPNVALSFTHFGYYFIVHSILPISVLFLVHSFCTKKMSRRPFLSQHYMPQTSTHALRRMR